MVVGTGKTNRDCFGEFFCFFFLSSLNEACFTIYKRDIYYDKTIVYLSKDPFYNVVRFEPVSDKHEHFLIHTFMV